MPTVTLTALQVQEITHKLGIVAEEEDLLESYEITQEEAEELEACFVRPGPCTFDARFASVIVGELENSLEIWQRNYRQDKDPEKLGLVRSIRDAIKKIERATGAD